jgi:hypothetical protein
MLIVVGTHDLAVTPEASREFAELSAARLLELDRLGSRLEEEVTAFADSRGHEPDTSALRARRSNPGR